MTAKTPEGYMPVFGIPYARQNDDGTVTCPKCGERIRQGERKDFESFSGREYATHYEAEHAEADGWVRVDGAWFVPTGFYD